MDKETKPKKMSYSTANYSIFADALRKLQLSPGQLATAIGYSITTPSHWGKVKRIPKAAALACECLLRRQNKENTQTPIDLYFLTVPKQHSLAIEGFCKVLKINAQLINFPPVA